MKIDKTTMLYVAGAVVIVLIILLISNKAKAKKSDLDYFQSGGGNGGADGSVFSGGSSGSSSGSGSSSSPSASWPVKYGDYNGNVGLLQQAVKTITGKNIAVDNAFGPNTANAVKTAANLIQFYDAASNMRINTPDSQVVVSKAAYDAFKSAAAGEYFRNNESSESWWDIDWGAIGDALGGGSSSNAQVKCSDLDPQEYYFVDDPGCSSGRKAISRLAQSLDKCCS